MKANGSPWFDKVARGIRLKDGSGHAVDCDVHPDPIAEAIRWQICEAELMQAIGRGRGVNRTADTPLDVDILADVCLPVTVAAVLPWATLAPNAGLEMLVEGVCLHSASDLAKCFPEIWPTSEASRDWLKPRNQPTTGENPFEYILTREFPACGRYQLPGARQKWRTFRYAPGVLSNPRAWLEARLGPLARFELTPLVSRRA